MYLLPERQVLELKGFYAIYPQVYMLAFMVFKNIILIFPENRSIHAKLNYSLINVNSALQFEMNPEKNNIRLP